MLFITMYKTIEFYKNQEAIKLKPNNDREIKRDRFSKIKLKTK